MKICDFPLTLGLIGDIGSSRIQGRNFGLKSGGTNSEGERSALGSRGDKRGEWGESTPSSSDSGVWESIVSSPSGVWDGATAENGFIVI